MPGKLILLIRRCKGCRLRLASLPLPSGRTRDPPPGESRSRRGRGHSETPLLQYLEIPLDSPLAEAEFVGKLPERYPLTPGLEGPEQVPLANRQTERSDRWRASRLAGIPTSGHIAAKQGRWRTFRVDRIVLA